MKSSTVSFSLVDRGSVKTVQSFIEDVFNVREATHDHKLWYRGHSRASFRLLPTIGREAKYAGREKLFTAEDERWLLHRFRRRAFAHDDDVRNAGYALFLARHYGLPTRLLDWTGNALFGLYFSCEAHLDSDGMVWAFRQRHEAEILDAFELANRPSEEKLFETKGGDVQIKIVHTVFNSARLIAQEGGFTLHSDPWRSLDEFAGKEFTASALDVEQLYRWLIPKEFKSPIIRQLSGLGISRRSVFPDLDGIARSLWETEVLWNGQPDRAV
jgi:hypothetical protein